METCKICLNEVEQWRYFPGMGYACNKCLRDHRWSEENQDLLLMKFRQIALQDRAKQEAKNKMKEILTVRDQFAIAALHGILADPMNNFMDGHMVAKCAYKMADAMLKQREVWNE